MKDFPISYRKEYDAQIAADEPVIGWRKKNNGIWVHTSINDPHVDSAHNGEKTACKHKHPYTAENTILRSDGSRQCRTCTNQGKSAREAANPRALTPEQRARKSELERQRRQRQRMEDDAREVAERFRKHRADNTPLLAAARTEI